MASAERTTGPQPPRRLLDEVRDRIRVKHYSIRTEEQYLQWVRRFILFHGKRHPVDMGAAEVEQFLTQRTLDRRIAKGSEHGIDARLIPGALRPEPVKDIPIEPQRDRRLGR